MPCFWEHWKLSSTNLAMFLMRILYNKTTYTWYQPSNSQNMRCSNTQYWKTIPRHIAPSGEKQDALFKNTTTSNVYWVPRNLITVHTDRFIFMQLKKGLVPERCIAFRYCLWNKKETNSIQIPKGVLGSACKNMTVLLTLSTLVTCRKNVKTHAESA